MPYRVWRVIRSGVPDAMLSGRANVTCSSPDMAPRGGAHVTGLFVTAVIAPPTHALSPSHQSVSPVRGSEATPSSGTLPAGSAASVVRPAHPAQAMALATGARNWS